MIQDECGYIWRVKFEVSKDDELVVKVNLGENYESKGDDFLEAVYIKIIVDQGNRSIIIFSP